MRCYKGPGGILDKSLVVSLEVKQKISLSDRLMQQMMLRRWLRYKVAS